MEVFVARQPIFDRKKRLFAYELLYRDGPENRYTGDDASRDTSRMIVQNLHHHEENDVSGGKPSFINATRDSLIHDHLTLLPADKFVIEILETVEPDDEVIAACGRLKKLGLKIALDDFAWSPAMGPLVAMADIIKVDFMATLPPERASIVKRLKRPGLSFLAEKVETDEDYQSALQDGYSYFQGYFFAKPAMMKTTRPMVGSKVQILQILKEFRQTNIDFDRLETAMKCDPALSYRILRYINSAHFGLRHKISSIKQAILYLGESELRKWVSLFAMAALVDDKPAELLTQSLVRAKLCESIVKKSPFLCDVKGLADECFMLGMFSLLDAMLDRSFEEVLRELPLEEEIKAALLGKSNTLRVIYECAIGQETGNWQRSLQLAEALAVDEDEMSSMYAEAVRWTDVSMQAAAIG